MGDFNLPNPGTPRAEDSRQSDTAPDTMETEQRIAHTVEEIVGDKVSRIEKYAKMVTTLGLGVTIALGAWIYITSEHKITNAFIRDEFVKETRAATKAQSDNAGALKDLAHVIAEQNVQQQLDRQQLGNKLDSLIEAQEDTAKALKELAPSNSRRLEQPQNEN